MKVESNPSRFVLGNWVEVEKPKDKRSHGLRGRISRRLFGSRVYIPGSQPKGTEKFVVIFNGGRSTAFSRSFQPDELVLINLDSRRMFVE